MIKLFLTSARIQSQWLVSHSYSSGRRANSILFQVTGDPEFPYVGKHIANLTLAQIKTLDCGSKRQLPYRELPKLRKKWCQWYIFPFFSAHQLIYPGMKISTLDELFEFARCADSERTIRWNIESKINSVEPNSTRGIDDFVTLQHRAFLRSGYNTSQITVGFSPTGSSQT